LSIPEQLYWAIASVALGFALTVVAVYA